MAFRGKRSAADCGGGGGASDSGPASTQGIGYVHRRRLDRRRQRLARGTGHGRNDLNFTGVGHGRGRPQGICVPTCAAMLETNPHPHPHAPPAQSTSIGAARLPPAVPRKGDPGPGPGSTGTRTTPENAPNTHINAPTSHAGNTETQETPIRSNLNPRRTAAIAHEGALMVHKPASITSDTACHHTTKTALMKTLNSVYFRPSSRFQCTPARSP